LTCFPIIDHGFHKKASWLHFTRNCHIYSNSPSIHPWCITYGCLSSWLCNTTLLWNTALTCCPIIDHGFHTQVSWLHFTRNCHIYSNRPSIHPWCITYGCLSSWLCNTTLLWNTALTCCPIIDHGFHTQVSWLHFTRNCHNYSIRPSIDPWCITYGYLSSWLCNTTLLWNTALTCCPIIDHGFHTQVSWLHFTRNCHNYSIRPSIDPWCITYGYLGTLWCDKTLLSIQHSHVVP